jgi:hypothetical protein
VVISQILGGLGNQMFQFAAGRALSLERGQRLCLDISGFGDYPPHQGFELHRIFECRVPNATEAEVRAVLGWQFSPSVRRIVGRPGWGWTRRPGFVVEPSFAYWAGLNEVPLDCYLVGYWQSMKYFEKYAPVLRRDFSFLAQKGMRDSAMAQQISQSNAVSIHLRRGDYLHDPGISAKHGVCSLDYYETALRHIADRLDRPTFFVFSDDIEWVRKNLKIAAPCQYVDHNRGASSFVDMYLMSLCQHNIIANSSFSWWAAWLNSNVDKMVLTPKKWFLQDIDTSDLIPQGWISL